MSNALPIMALIYNQKQTRGVIFGNIFDRCNVILKVYGGDELATWSVEFSTIIRDFTVTTCFREQHYPVFQNLQRWRPWLD